MVAVLIVIGTAAPLPPVQVIPTLVVVMAILLLNVMPALAHKVTLEAAALIVAAEIDRAPPVVQSAPWGSVPAPAVTLIVEGSSSHSPAFPDTAKVFTEA